MNINPYQTNTETNMIQWNLNGFFKRYVNLQVLIKEYLPTVICLQETHFKGDYCAKLNGYDKYYCNRQSIQASGGVATYIKNDFHSEQVNLNTQLEAIAVTCYFPYKITICNLYLPNSQTLTLEDLNKLKTQLPKPYVILGDFNAHNEIWGSKKK